MTCSAACPSNCVSRRVCSSSRWLSSRRNWLKSAPSAPVNWPRRPALPDGCRICWICSPVGWWCWTAVVSSAKPTRLPGSCSASLWKASCGASSSASALPPVMTTTMKSPCAAVAVSPWRPGPCRASQLQAQLARNERLSALGRMVASLAHQIRTPLSTALLYASHLNQPELTANHRQRFSQRLKDRLQAIELQVRDMLLFAKGDLPLNSQVSARELFRELRQQAETLIVEAGADCRWADRTPADVQLVCNRETLLGAALNLIENAIQAGYPQPRLKVILRLQEGRLSLNVVDGGKGMTRAELARIGEPFYTTREQGTGLGVSVVKSVA